MMRLKRASLRRVACFTAVATAATALAACGDDGGGATAGCPDGNDEVSYLMNWDGTTPQDLALWVALDRGYFEDECIDVKYEPGKGSSQVAQLVSAGQFDLGNMAAASLVQVAATSESDLVSVGAGMPADTNGWVFFEESGISEPSDLEGRTIGTSSQSYLMQLLPALAEVAGFDVDKVNAVNVDLAARFGLLTQGQIEATSVSVGESAMAPLLEHGAVDMFVLADYLTLIGVVIVANKENVDEKADEIQRFITAMSRAWGDLQNDSENAVVDAAQYMQDKVAQPPSVATFEEITAPVLGDVMEFTDPDRPGWTHESEWTSMIEVLVEAMDATRTPTAAELMTNQFVENVNQ